MRGAIFVLAAILGALAGGAAAGEPGVPPGGPGFGNNAFEGEIRGEGVPDRDDFVARLVQGETLSASVRPRGEGGLRPRLSVLAPDGGERAAGERVRVPVDRTGTWVVRVSGAEGSEGGYLVRFRIGGGRAGRVRREFAPGERSRVETVPFEALGGGTLSFRLEGLPAGGPAPLVGLLDPTGEEVRVPRGFFVERPGRFELRRWPMDGPDGTWRLLVGVDREPLRLSLRADPPERRRGTTVLDPREPHLDPREVPLPAIAGGLVRLEGAGFARFPLPRVFVGGEAATVVSVGDRGEFLDCLLPPLPRETPLPVLVANPDGQACEEPDHVLVLPPGPAAAYALLPESLRVDAEATVPVSILLSGRAPPGGATVHLALEGDVGSVPASVIVGADALEARFDFRAAAAPGRGILRATLGSTVAIPVEVVVPPAPPAMDLSGWRLVQTDAARSWTLPAGSLVARGGSLVVARKAAQADFEKFWKAALPKTTVFLDSGDRFPSLNGDETLSLYDAEGMLVDGPTLRLAAGRAYLRVPGLSAFDALGWVEAAAVPGSFAPGAAPPPAAGPAGLRIHAFADPSGSGQFVHEFVEIRW